MLLDEWQAVPSVLGAVKRAVDQDPRPGRFLLTGSVRADLEAETWPGTGRLVRLRLYGLTIRELNGLAAARPVLDRLAQGDLGLFTVPSRPPDLAAYVDMTLQSGFPEALIRLSGRRREAWLDGYLDQLLTRDAVGISGLRDPARLRRYFEALALSSAGMPHDQTLYEAAGIDRKTAVQYEGLLCSLFVLDLVHAWETNRLDRLTKRPKRYVVDPALVSAALRMDSRAILKDGDLLGRILDTFVMAQLRPELDVSALRPRLYHFRDRDGRREVDVIGELAAGIVGLEVKATAAPTAKDAAHLIFLRDKFGPRFLGGAVLHTGPGAFVLSKRVFALPICALWG